MEQLQETRLGMVLSGGGAKGAYQIGFFGAMEQYGLWEHLEIISGSSIGAVNALLCATKNFSAQKAAWDAVTIESVATRKNDAVGFPWDYYPDVAHRFAGMSLEEYLDAAKPFPFSQASFLQMLAPYLPLGANCPLLYVCAYNMERLLPEYFCLNDQSCQDAAALVLASGCIPILYPPVEFHGFHYCDGGLVPPYFAGTDNSDKIPLEPLRNCGCGLVIVVYLSQYDTLDLSILPAGCQVLEVYPTQPLEHAPGTGTLDFSPEAKTHHMELGYADGCRLLEKLQALLAAGNSLQAATQQLNAESNRHRLTLP